MLRSTTIAIVFAMIMLPASLHAQKNRKVQQKDPEQIMLEQLDSLAEQAREAGDLVALDEALTRLLKYEYKKDLGVERSQVRLQLNDSAGYCSDLFRASSTGDKLRDQYKANCVRHDSIPFEQAGLRASRYPEAISVSRTKTKSDGRTHYRLYDKRDSLLVGFYAFGSDTIFSNTDTMPEYPGGEAELFKFLGKSIKYPQSALERGLSGVVYLQFIVGRTGEIRNIEVIRGIQHSLDEESMRVLKAMPYWKPAIYQGEPVDLWYQLPIRYTLR